MGSNALYKGLATNVPRHAVRIARLALVVDDGERLATVLDALGELHLRCVRFSGFLCLNCVRRGLLPVSDVGGSFIFANVLKGN